MRIYLLGFVLNGAIPPPVVELLEIGGGRDTLRGNYGEKKAATQHGQAINGGGKLSLKGPSEDSITMQ
jgi:hypothetical protein